MKTIHRVKRKNHYTSIPNGLMRDRRICFQARAILSMMLTMPEDWVTYVDVILEFGSEEHGQDGEMSVRRSLKQLQKIGYLERTRIRGERGRFDSVLWVWKDEPESGFPRSGFPRRGDPHAKKDRSKKDAATDSPSGTLPENARRKDKGSFVPKHTRLYVKRLPQYPQTEDELVELLETYGLDYDPDHDGNFWEEFTKRHWKMPNGDPVADVAKLYEARTLTTVPS